MALGHDNSAFTFTVPLDSLDHITYDLVSLITAIAALIGAFKGIQAVRSSRDNSSSIDDVQQAVDKRTAQLTDALAAAGVPIPPHNGVTPVTGNKPDAKS